MPVKPVPAPLPPARAAARRPGALVGLAVIGAVLLVASSSAAFAAAGRHVTPHAVQRAFKVLKGGGGEGNGAVMSNGTYVLASRTDAGTAIAVCTMKKGARSCANSPSIHVSGNSGFGSYVGVVRTGASDVTIVATECCYVPTVGYGMFEFNSTNDGKTFSKAYYVGNFDSLSAATYAGGQIVVVQRGSETLIQAFDPAAVASSGWVPLDTDAKVQTHDAEDAYVATAKNGGVLVGSDNGTSTYVYFAPKTADFNKSSSYHQVGQFGHETLVDLSGDAMQTDIGGGLTGDERLRFFNGTSIPAKGFKVPEPNQGDDGGFTMAQIGGVVHDYFFNRRNGYDVYTATTSNGAHWSNLTVFPGGGGIDAGWFAPVLNSSGIGVLFETDGAPQWAQPIGNW